MEPSIRKPLGILIILVGLSIYALVVMSFADTLGELAKPAQALIYLILGIAWLLPLRPLLVWMNK